MRPSTLRAKAILTALTAACGLALFTRASAAPPAAPLLQLSTGDFVTGQLIDSTEENVIHWKCAAAEHPFQFPLSAVSGAHFPLRDAPAETGADFSLELIGGDVIRGALLSLSADAVEIDAPHLGRVRVERPHVERLVRIGKGSGLEYLGPNGLTGWTSPDKVNKWTEEAGHLVASKPGTIASPACPLPDRASIELEISWKQKAGFSLAFGADAADLDAAVVRALRQIRLGDGAPPQTGESTTSVFQLEVWGRKLVLVRERENEADLAHVADLAPAAGRIQLRVFVDQKEGRIAVYSVEGKLLAQVEAAPNSRVVKQGVKLVNKRGDVRLEHLAIREWVGDLPSEVESARTYVQRTNGDVNYAEAPTFDAATKEFVIEPPQGEEPPAGEAIRVPAAEIARIAFAPAAEAPAFAIRAALFDGTRLSGDLQEVRDGRVYIQRPGVESPLALPLAEVRFLASLAREKADGPAKGRLGRFETEGVRLRGVLVDAEPTPQGNCLVWHPQGSINASPLVHGVSGRIIYRDLPPPAIQPPAQPAGQRIRLAVAQPVQQRQVGFFGIFNIFGGNDQNNQAARPVIMEDPRDELLWLRGGDRLPCKLTSIDERGVAFTSTLVDATFLPHDSVKAWERVAGDALHALDEKKRQRLLTLPRIQRDNPPTHLVEFTGGDFLRCRLSGMNETSLHAEVRLEPKELSRDRVARIIWLHEEEGEADNEAENHEAEDGETKHPAPSPSRGGLGRGADDEDIVANQQDAPHLGDDDQPPPTQMQAVRRDGVRLTFTPERVANASVEGRSTLLGFCQVAVNEIDQLLFGDDVASAARDLPYHQWQLRPAPDPRFVTEDGQPGEPAAPASELAGKPAPDFRLELLGGGELTLSKERGHVVVLDFWASWCGPCMQSMPQLDEVAKELAGEDVRFFAVNLQEDRETVAAALERVKVTPAVALDVDGAAAEKFAVTAIPQTVVIDRQGNIATVLIGGRPDFAEQLRAAIRAAIAAGS